MNFFYRNTGIKFAFLSFLLMLCLVYSWVDFSGKVKNVIWEAPSPLPFDVSVYKIDENKLNFSNEENLLLQINERPLFVMGRKPLPSAIKNQQVVAPKENILDKVEISGIFLGRAVGLIIQVNGKERSLMLNEKLDDWQLISINNDSAEFAFGEEKRTLLLKQPKY